MFHGSPDFDDDGNFLRRGDNWLLNSPCNDGTPGTVDLSDPVARPKPPLIIGIDSSLADRIKPEDVQFFVNRLQELGPRYGRLIVVDMGEKGRGVMGKDTNNSWRSACLWTFGVPVLILGATLLVVFLMWRFILPLLNS